MPPKLPARPLPGTALKSSTVPSSLALASKLSSFSTPAITAFASGCSLLLSIAYAFIRSSSRLTPAAGYTSVIIGAPLVMVPVLSRTTTFALPVSSRDTAVLNMIPCLAPTPFPTMIATGVASPSAQGQLMTSTEIALASA